MANTYTQIYIHSVFAVYKRNCLIDPSWKDELFKYMTGIIQNYGHKMLAINGMTEHIHFLAGLNPDQSISKMIQDVKANSSRWINQRGFLRNKFKWQEGYGAFSYGQSQMNHIIGYIKNQEEHHRKRTFQNEYLDFLKKFRVEYDEKYLFEFF